MCSSSLVLVFELMMSYFRMGVTKTGANVGMPFVRQSEEERRSRMDLVETAR